VTGSESSSLAAIGSLDDDECTVRYPPDNRDADRHNVNMRLSIPSVLSPAIANVLTSARPSLRLIGMSGLPAAQELQAFLISLATVPAEAPTACAGWSTHDLVAHMAAGSEEMTRLITARLARGFDGDDGPTRPFEEREAPFRAMEDRALRRTFVVHALALSNAILKLQTLGPFASVTFTGWEMTASELIRHGQSELILHRWDLVGSDSTSWSALSRPDLMEHGRKAMERMNIFGGATQLRESNAVPGALLALWGRDPDREFQRF
jgi:Mycothiol maleylpyruvate isomerase N-terminal domain